MFIRVMFAHQILGTAAEFAEDFRREVTELQVIPRDAAVTAELWLRSKHGTWRFFRITATGLEEINREGKPVIPGQTIA